MYYHTTITRSKLSSAESEPLLKVEGLQMNYKTRRSTYTAFANINLDVCHREVVCLLGASGCGKSSLLMAIAGLKSANKGQIYLEGRPLTSPHPQIGLVFQRAALLPWLSVRQNIGFGLQFTRMDPLSKAELESRINLAINSVNLDGFEQAYPHQLSGGMAQRVALGRALARQPKLLLLDEPFSGLDAINRLEMQKLLLEVIEQHQSTILLVTHGIDEALLLGDRIFLMSRYPGAIDREWRIMQPKPRFKEAHTLAEMRLTIFEELSSLMDWGK